MSQDASMRANPPGRRGLPAPPYWLVAGGIIFVAASFLPLALIARARFSTSTQPRVHIAQDMAKQPKFREQMSSSVFADGRADRSKIPSAVARGELEEDDHYYRGYAQKTNPQTKQPEIVFFDRLPAQMQLSKPFLLRGQERFNTYCAVCHGLDGFGKGPVNERATELMKTGQANWVAAADLHSDVVRTRADGHLYNTIANGIRTMPAYGGQISVEDRWAVVAYVRALQFSQNAPARVLTPEQLKSLGPAQESKP